MESPTTSPTTDASILTEEMIAEIKALFPRYPTLQAVVLPALHIVNHQLRHVPLKAVEEIAQLLELHPAQVQDTLTFYGFFKQDKPHGKTRAWVCRSISCSLRGGEEMLDYLCQQLGIEEGGTTEDQQATIEPAECLGACEFAPCMLAGEEVHQELTKEKIDAFVASLKASSNQKR